MNRTITCVCGCARTGPHHGRGLIKPCWYRARRNGQLDRWPATRPAPQNRPMRLVAPSVAGRIEDYIELREDHRVSRVVAAARLGVTPRTVTRWNSHLRAQGATYPWLYTDPRTKKEEQDAA